MHVQVLIGTYTRGTSSDGIYTAEWQTGDDRLTVMRLAARADNPSLVLPVARRRRVYAVNEVADRGRSGEGAICSYEHDAGRLVLRATLGSGGGLPCALALDPTERHLAVANYGGSVALLPLDANGDVGARSFVVPHPKGSVHPRRQTVGHPHGVAFIDGDLWVPDLGGDAVYRYQLEGDTLVALPPLVARVGSGPRLVVRHSALPVCYLVHELTNEVTVWRCEEQGWSIAQRVQTLAGDSAGSSAASDIRLTADGGHLYVTNRGENSLVGYAVARDGTLAAITRVATGGAHPRAFSLSPDGAWVLVANRDSNNVTVFRRNEMNGELTGPMSEHAVPAPSCIAFVPAT